MKTKEAKALAKKLWPRLWEECGKRKKAKAKKGRNPKRKGK